MDAVRANPSSRGCSCVTSRDSFRMFPASRTTRKPGTTSLGPHRAPSASVPLSRSACRPADRPSLSIQHSILLSPVRRCCSCCGRRRVRSVRGNSGPSSRFRWSSSLARVLRSIGVLAVVCLTVPACGRAGGAPRRVPPAWSGCRSPRSWVRQGWAQRVCPGVLRHARAHGR